MIKQKFNIWLFPMVHHLIHYFIIEVMDQSRFRVFKHKWTGWQKWREGAKGLRQKVWTRTKILGLIYATLSDIKICRDFRTFFKTLGMKVFFGSNTVFFWARGVLLHGIFAYYDDDSLFLYCKFKGSSNSDIYYTWQVLSTHLGPYKALNPNTWNNNNYNSRKWK